MSIYYQKLLYETRDKRYEEYKTKMYAAGLQKIIDEVQKQIDTWAKANGKK